MDGANYPCISVFCAFVCESSITVAFTSPSGCLLRIAASVSPCNDSLFKKCPVTAYFVVQITFIFLFWWIIAFVLLGLAGLIVYHAGRRAHLWTQTDLNIRLAVSHVHLSYLSLLVASVYLFKFLRGGASDNPPYQLSSPQGCRLLTICLSMTAVWVISSSAAQIAVFRGQKAREAEREVQMAEGRVWTQGTTLHNEMATIVRQVDALSREEIIKKV